MVVARNFKKLEIYHLAHQFVLDIYELVKDFPKHEDNNLTSQLRRAVTCLPLNIAEGSGAKSNKVFLSFLVFCYRSCLECEACLRLSKDLGYIDENKFNTYFENLDKLVRKLYRYMQNIEARMSARERCKSYFYRQNKNNIDSDMKKRDSMRALC